MRLPSHESPRRGSLVCWLLVASWLLSASSTRVTGEETAAPTAPRPLWTTSRVVGSPEPPPPYSVEEVWTSAELKSPLYVAQLPGTEYLLVVLQGGEEGRPSRILRLEDDPRTQVPPAPFLEVERRLVYGLTFHPDFASNGYLYVLGCCTSPAVTARAIRTAG